jgi:hypothetical protein
MIRYLGLLVDTEGHVSCSMHRRNGDTSLALRVTIPALLQDRSATRAFILILLLSTLGGDVWSAS